MLQFRNFLCFANHNLDDSMHSCVNLIGVDINDFGSLALKSKNPVKIIYSYLISKEKQKYPGQHRHIIR